MDIDQTLYHSATTGFYLKSSHGQIKKGGWWNTALLDYSHAATKSEKSQASRRVITVFRPMTPEQSLSWIVDSGLPGNSTGKELLLSALTACVGSEVRS